MQTETTAAPVHTDQSQPRLAQSLRLWPAVVLVLLYWALSILVRQIDMPYFFRFMFGMAAPAFLVLSMTVWWATRKIRLSAKLLGILLVLAGGAVAMPLSHPSIGVFGLLFTGLPVVLTAWTLAMLLTRKTIPRLAEPASAIVGLLAWSLFLVFRIDGVDGDLRPDMRWRWSPGAEDLFLASQTSDSATAGSTLPAWAPTLTPGDWTGFRGPNRDGVIRTTAFATDWSTRPPRQLWRRRVGPAWSSVIVIGDRLFTQEQHGENEAVVCCDSATGKQLWVHVDPARFTEPVSGPGPRGTPTFADNRIFSLGATGILNCLDAATGKKHWSRDIKTDAAAPVPQWGFSGSPLVFNGLVVVFAGGDGEKNLFAFRTTNGEPAWTARVGNGNYSSPQLTTVAGKPQVLFLSDHGLRSVDPATGALLWEHGQALPNAPRTAQPHLIGDRELLVATLSGYGVSLLEVSPQGESWHVEERWTSTDLKPEFPDLVVHQGHAFGFDVNIFCCIDTATGKRRWKAGRYGRGQVMLLADQPLLLVLSETGEAVLLAADPEKHHELGKFRALEGKTWNHPVIAHGRLYARNAEEMACYELNEK